MSVKSRLLLRPKDFKPSFPEWNIDGALNPAAVRLPNKKIMLYVRIAESVRKSAKNQLVCPVIVSEEHYKTIEEEVRHGQIKTLDGNLIYLKNGMCRLTNISHFRRVILRSNGFDVESIDDSPAFTGMPENEELGVEDPRMTKIGNKYYMTYVSISKNNGVSTSLAVSEDCLNWKRLGIIFAEQNKDSVIFPEKINGKYVALNRPETLFDFSRPGIWISYSKDLIYWGRERSIIKPRENSWEQERVGAGPPPLKTKEGWLLIYHGVHNKTVRKKELDVYSVGAVLLGLKNPEKILARTSYKKPILTPSRRYQKIGYKREVIFPTGVVTDLNGRDLLIYSGGADSVTSVDKISIREIIKSLKDEDDYF